jgi:hypothetical protein
MCRLLERTDKAALEAGNLAFIMAREIQERAGSEVRVLNSGKLPFIWEAPMKTDKEGAMKLARGERRREVVQQLLRGHEREEAEWILKYLELHDARDAASLQIRDRRLAGREGAF